MPSDSASVGGTDMKKILKIEGMSCGHCAMRVKSALLGVKGIKSAEVTVVDGQAVVEGEGFLDTALSAAVAEAGYVLKGVVG